MVLSQAPKLEKLRVQEALFIILGQDYRSAVNRDDRRPGAGRFFRNKAFAAQDDETYDDTDAYDDGYYEYDDGYAATEYEAFDENWTEDYFDSNAAYYEGKGNYNADDAETLAEFDIDTYDEAYAAYLDTRRRFQDIKLSRGFLPVVALDQSSMANGKGKGSKGKARVAMWCAIHLVVLAKTLTQKAEPLPCCIACAVDLQDTKQLNVHDQLSMPRLPPLHPAQRSSTLKAWLLR